MFDQINLRLEGKDLSSDRLRDQALREIVQEIALFGLTVQSCKQLHVIVAIP